MRTVQQQTVINHIKTGKRSARVRAVAGAGKTTTLVDAACEVPTWMSVAFLVYNTKNAKEIKAKLATKNAGKNIRAGTFHSFGSSALYRHKPNAQLVEHKNDLLLEELKVHPRFHPFVKDLVGLGKQHVLKPIDLRTEALPLLWARLVNHHDLALKLEDGDNPDEVRAGIELANDVLALGNAKLDEVYDFDDQLYAPLLLNLKVWQNHLVFVDEAQDTNPARRLWARKLLLPTGKLIAVGDPYQAIYGFTGADNDALDLIAKDFDTVDLDLTVCFRCDRRIVEYARTVVPHIEPAPGAADGVVEHMTKADFDKQPASAFSESYAVLCRNTAPLVELAFGLISRKIPCHIEGRDFGGGLIAIVNKWKKAKTVEQFVTQLNAWVEKEVAALTAKKQTTKAGAVEDRAQCLRVLAAQVPQDGSRAALVNLIRDIFGDTKEGERPRGITLSTVHKAKGREWPVVYLLGRNQLMPSRWARQEWEQDQERNLIYVAITRAQNRLVEVIL